MPVPTASTEEALFKPAGAGWIFAAPNPWTFARRRSYLVDDVQKVNLAQRLRSGRKFRPQLGVCTLVLGSVISSWAHPHQAWPVASHFLLAVFMIVYPMAINLCDYFAVRKALVGLPRVGLRDMHGKQALSVWVKAFIMMVLVEALTWTFLRSPRHSPYLLTAATCFCLLAVLCSIRTARILPSRPL
jgi:hypothetical protein